jgi:hypothetical protein
MSAYTYIHTYIHTHTHTYSWLSVCGSVHIKFVSFCMHMHAPKGVKRRHGTCPFGNTYIRCIHAYKHINKHMHACTHNKHSFIHMTIFRSPFSAFSESSHHHVHEKGGMRNRFTHKYSGIANTQWYAGNFCVSCTICPYYCALSRCFDTQGLRIGYPCKYSSHDWLRKQMLTSLRTTSTSSLCLTMWLRPGHIYVRDRDITAIVALAFILVTIVHAAREGYGRSAFTFTVTLSITDWCKQPHLYRYFINNACSSCVKLSITPAISLSATVAKALETTLADAFCPGVCCSVNS